MADGTSLLRTQNDSVLQLGPSFVMPEAPSARSPPLAPLLPPVSTQLAWWEEGHEGMDISNGGTTITRTVNDFGPVIFILFSDVFCFRRGSPVFS
jgi:hypothetical protein